LHNIYKFAKIKLETVKQSLRFHAGHQLNDKEFRYIIILIVKTAVNLTRYTKHLRKNLLCEVPGKRQALYSIMY